MNRRLAGFTLAAVVLAWISVSAAGGQDYYRKTAARNPVTGRQEIIDLHVPHWTGPGQGGLMFDGPSGCLQMAAVGRSPQTGRLAYVNQYMNPWSGARYTTATSFNAHTRRYETMHRFLPPPERETPSAPPVSQAQTHLPAPRRGIRVINVAPPQGPALSADAQQTASPLSVQTYPKGGATIKVLESAIPAPPGDSGQATP